ncbi:tetratricopeptide repeat protein [Dongia mobilis]|uniref:Tetratricopeptide repeat protein n=1 Tax=Dongia mobilis TaxID=578943 RepID=A0A4R6WRY3_9PROT|nr:tetratricopeptide repeat protein [Dongia mobilis]TDQ84372.1 tetratricopeptide repeat protein [Dongia mobilis]
MNRKSRRTAAKHLRTADTRRADAATSQVLIDQAVAAAQSGRWQEAEKVLRYLLSVDPDNAEALHMMGMALGSTGRATEGIDMLRRATELKPSEALYWQNLAACLLGAEQPHKAAEAARHAVTLEPGYVAAWSRLGDALAETQDFNGACGAYERVQALAGQELGNLKRIANCQMNLGRLDIAEATLKSADAMAPDDPEILANLGAVLVARSNYVDAVEVLAKAVEHDSKKFTVVYHYARALAGAGKAEPALLWARKATALEHRSLNAWVLLGKLALDLGHLAEAEVAARRATQLGPDTSEARQLNQRLKGVAPATKQTPAYMDFHLGDPDAVAPVPGVPLNVTFTDAPVQKVPSPKDPMKKDDAKAPAPDGTFDFTILKID